MGVLLSLFGGKEDDIVQRLFGPAADEIGAFLRRRLEYARGNARRVVDNASQKVGPAENGAVPRGVAMRLLEDASYSDDDVVIEYLGGVLASAYTPVSRDDRGAAWSRVVSSLSTYQLRFHYLLYREARKALLGRDVDLGPRREANRHHLFISHDDFVRCLEFGENEDPTQIARHVVRGLQRHGLVGEGFSYSEDVDVTSKHAAVLSAGLIVAPSGLGAELFLWAHGLGLMPLTTFTDPSVDFGTVTADVPEPLDAGLVDALVAAARVDAEASSERPEPPQP